MASFIYGLMKKKFTNQKVKRLENHLKEKKMKQKWDLVLGLEFITEKGLRK